MEFTIAHRIWNRACGDSDTSALAGDVALEFLLLAHGYIMNGGVFHAADDLDTDLLIEAQAGYRSFGFCDIADLLDRARSIPKAGRDVDYGELELGKRYYASVPDDSTLFARFEQHFREKPKDFAPL